MSKSFKSYIIPFVEIAAKSLSVVSIFILTRLLSQEDFGEFNYINSIVLVFSVLLDLGINSKAYTLSLLNKKNELTRLYYTRLLLSLIILGLFNLSLLAFTNINFTAIGLYSIVIWGSSFVAFIKLTSRGMGFFKPDTLAIVIEPLLRVLSLSVIFFLHNKWDLNSIYVLFIIIGAISLIAVLFNAKKYFDLKWSKGLISFNELKNTIVDTRHFILYYLFMVAIQRIEIFFIREKFDYINVAVYFSAFNLIMAMQLFFRAAVTSRYKQFVDKRISFKQFSLELGASLTFIIIISYFIIPIVFDIVYPSAYINGIPIFKILLLQLPFYTINVFIINQFNVKNSSIANTYIFGLILILKLAVLFNLRGLAVNTFAWVSVSFEILTAIGFTLLMKIKKIKPENLYSQHG